MALDWKGSAPRLTCICTQICYTGLLLLLLNNNMHIILLINVTYGDVMICLISTRKLKCVYLI